MKLLYCRRCRDVIQMRPELRTCYCGESSGRYIDNETVAQTEGSISIALHNHDFKTAVDAFDYSPDAWHPMMVFRAYINPRSEPDVKFIAPAEPS